MRGSSRYSQIALDMAHKIVQGELTIGEKLYGRSTLASLYNVSPETIRRSLALLSQAGIVEVNQGSGVTIRSKDLAYEFIEKYKSKNSLVSIKKELRKLVKQKKEMENHMYELINNLIEYSDNLKHITPYNPFEIEIDESYQNAGRTVAEVEFWKKTGGTIIAIKRGEEMIISPGPNYTLNVGDTIVVVGDLDVYYKVKRFLSQD
ncbi:TrkA C-terminal domain-containing protein [Garciella nitratireducens]|uniref:Regulatory protein, gntR family n=1 Tax=Garciella nitratireducens DSM 15102 TaxID=1121911 RepID=A0A1T4LKI6_9FIRM|nr:TrkA C-terminal domain-containing protein [Garciella nitratireducens]SJZ55136.1 regulatory protein, gntR family [Garciella nitratireducens DSM 15102]